MEKVNHKKVVENKREKLRTIDIAYIGILTALICICSWISIPMTVPFTMQTFAIFLSLCLMGGKRGIMSIIIYLLLGTIGLPVFANFKTGIGAIVGPTGGYILGFIFTAIIYWFMVEFFGEKSYIQIIAMILGLIACYAFGTAWFIQIYAKTKSPVGVDVALSVCVYPFIIPDLIKLVSAFSLSKVLKRNIKSK